MRRPLALWLFSLASLWGCDATGTTHGGQALIVDPCATQTLQPTWANLYSCYFGPSGKASCTAQGFCHGGPDQTGAIASGFVCGSTLDSCWQGMTMGLPACDAGQGQTGGGHAGASDAGGGNAGDAGAGEAGNGFADGSTDANAGGDDAGASCNPPVPPLVPIGTDPQATGLWSSLRGAEGPGLHNMPYSNGGGVSFGSQDLDRISAWIQAGAKND